jgi:hypothetical protein
MPSRVSTKRRTCQSPCGNRRQATSYFFRLIAGQTLVSTEKPLCLDFELLGFGILVAVITL